MLKPTELQEALDRLRDDFSEAEEFNRLGHVNIAAGFLRRAEGRLTELAYQVETAEAA